MLGSKINNWVKKLYTYLKSKPDSGEIFENVTALYVLQGLNYLLPFVTLPYLLRVLGVDNYGIVVLIQAVVTYFLIFTSYGFDISATKDISIAKDHLTRSKIFHSVLAIKLIFIIISFLVIGILSFFITSICNEFRAYIYGMLIIVGQGMFPIWYFKGVRKMKLITIVNVISKIVMTLLIFVLVKSPQDYELAILANSLGYLIAGIFSLVYVYTRMEIFFLTPSISEIKAQLIEGWYIFTSRVFVNLYTTTNIIILGIFTNTTEVGRFGVIDRILRAFSGLAGPLIEGVYPNMAVYFNKNRSYYLRFVKKIKRYLSLSFILLSIASFTLSDYIIYLINGEFNEVMSMYLKVISLAIVFLPYGPLFTNMLVIQGYKKELNKFVMYSALINIIIVIPMVYFFEGLGLAITIVITFAFIAIIKGLFIQSKLNLINDDTV